MRARRSVASSRAREPHTIDRAREHPPFFSFTLRYSIRRVIIRSTTPTEYGSHFRTGYNRARRYPFPWVSMVTRQMCRVHNRVHLACSLSEWLTSVATLCALEAFKHLKSWFLAEVLFFASRTGLDSAGTASEVAMKDGQRFCSCFCFWHTKTRFSTLCNIYQRQSHQGTKKPAIIGFNQQLRASRVAPAAGFEPATNWLTANCATTALRRNKVMRQRVLQPDKSGGEFT